MEEPTRKYKKKRYGWLLFFASLNWLSIFYMVFMVSPDSVKDFIIPGSYLPMLALIAGGVFWILSIIFMSAVRALWWTAGITFYLFLRVFHLGTIMNGALIVGLLISWEVYQIKSKPKTEANIQSHE